MTWATGWRCTISGRAIFSQAKTNSKHKSTRACSSRVKTIVIGILRRAAVIDAGDGLVELVNPEVLETSGEQGCYEGCLSFPGERGYVVRPEVVRVKAQDREGNMHEYEAKGLFARAVLHECDHLDGLVYKRLITQAPEGYDEEQEEDTE